MPQMSPILWAPLFIFFLLLTYMVASHLYFEAPKNVGVSEQTSKHLISTWKW